MNENKRIYPNELLESIGVDQLLYPRGKFTPGDSEIFGNGPINKPFLSQEELTKVVEKNDDRADIIMDPVSTVGRMSVGKLVEATAIKIQEILIELLKGGPLEDMTIVVGYNFSGDGVHIKCAARTTKQSPHRAMNRVRAFRGYLARKVAEAEKKVNESTV